VTSYSADSQNPLPAYCNGVTLSLKELLPYKSQTVRWLPPAKSLWAQLNGQHQSRQKGRGMNFSEVRKYQAGDDIRAIDWRVTARTGKPHTKLFTEEREKPVMLYLDFSRSMRFGSRYLLKSVQMAHMASLISWLAVGQQDRVGAVLDSGQQLHDIRPGARNRGPLQLLSKLTEQHNQALTSHSHTASSEPEQPLSRGIYTLNRLCPKGSDIIICSDFTRLDTEQDKALVAKLRQHNQIQFIHFYDPLERGDTSYRGTEKIAGKRTTRWLNFSSKTTRSQLENAFMQQQDKLSSLCQSLAIPLYTISSAEPLIKQITGSPS